MSNYDKWLKTGEELLRKAEETMRMRDTMLVSKDGKTAIFFHFHLMKRKYKRKLNNSDSSLKLQKESMKHGTLWLRIIHRKLVSGVKEMT